MGGSERQLGENERFPLGIRVWMRMGSGLGEAGMVQWLKPAPRLC